MLSWRNATDDNIIFFDFVKSSDFLNYFLFIILESLLLSSSILF